MTISSANTWKNNIKVSTILFISEKIISSTRNNVGVGVYWSNMTCQISRILLPNVSTGFVKWLRNETKANSKIILHMKLIYHLHCIQKMRIHSCSTVDLSVGEPMFQWHQLQIICIWRYSAHANNQRNIRAAVVKN